MFDKVFISYATEDLHYADKLYNFLASNGFLPWMDKRNLLPGQNWDFIIQRELRKADFIVILLSENSVSKRGYVQKEFNQAIIYCEEKLDSDIYIIPVLISSCAVPPKLAKFQWIEYSSDDSFNKIYNSLNIQRNILEKAKKQNEASLSGFEYDEKKLIGSYGDKGPKQLYEIEYPLFKKHKVESLHEINILIEGEILDYLMNARENYYENLLETEETEPTEEFSLMLEDSTLFGQISFQVLTENFISYTSFWSIYNTGGAHGNFWTKGYNYYLSPLRNCNLGQLFGDFSKSLLIIRDLVHDKMMQKAKNEFHISEPSEFYLFDKVLPAEEKNFKNYIVKSNSIVFIYNPYQLTAFSFGDHHIEVTFDELKFIFPGEKKLIEYIKMIKAT
jgi:hypothetical protein